MSDNGSTSPAMSTYGDRDWGKRFLVLPTDAIRALGPTRTLVLAAIINRESVSGGGMCLRALADDCGLSLRQTQRHVYELVAGGYITMDPCCGRSSLIQLTPLTHDKMSRVPLTRWHGAPDTNPRQNVMTIKDLKSVVKEQGDVSATHPVGCSAADVLSDDQAPVVDREREEKRGSWGRIADLFGMPRDHRPAPLVSIEPPDRGPPRPPRRQAREYLGV